ncbi:MAG: VanZ family protein [Oscillospiraceae bacterium]
MIKLLLVAAMLIFIWGNSMIPGELSSLESEWFLSLVYPVIERVQHILADFGHVYELSFLVRKLAHFSEYALLGVLMYWLFLKPNGRGRVVLSALLCLSAACVDEGIQIFAIERGPALKDVILDFAGSCAGIFAMAVVISVLYALTRPFRRR